MYVQGMQFMECRGKGGKGNDEVKWRIKFGKVLFRVVLIKSWIVFRLIIIANLFNLCNNWLSKAFNFKLGHEFKSYYRSLKTLVDSSNFFFNSFNFF
jgi:hypothetical protein